MNVYTKLNPFKFGFAVFLTVSCVHFTVTVSIVQKYKNLKILLYNTLIPLIQKLQ